jgi:hypothetical protein
MKVVDVVLEKIFYGICKNINTIDNGVFLQSDLNITSDTFNLILSRVQTILNIPMLQNNFNDSYTLGDLRKLIEIEYKNTIQTVNR